MLELLLIAVSLTFALVLRPWRLLANARPLVHETTGAASGLWTPLLATLTLLPWLWALPTLHHMPLQLQWSGACLVLLMLGWPLAVLALASVASIAWAVSPTMGAHEAAALLVWSGLVPATLALAWGALLRRFLGTRVFVYIMGRGFFGTVLCLFAAGLLAEMAGHDLARVNDISHTARWLMAWGDAVITGMLSAVFVAFKPHWLATWSDALYLRPTKL